MDVGYKLFAEGHAPPELVRQAIRAEDAGFDFVEISDHFHPWLDVHGHSGFAWSILAAIGASTDRIGLATGVTCPFLRYHPAVIAQAAATTAVLTDGRFVLGVGTGERLNEHVVGRGWPPIDVRQDMLRESIEIIRLLWSGGFHSYRGRFLNLDDGRVFDLPPTPPPIVVAAGGGGSARLAASAGDGLFTTEPDPDLVDGYTRAGGTGPRYAEVSLSWAPTESGAAESARTLFRFGALGWPVQAELPTLSGFDSASRFVTADDMRSSFGCGPDVDAHLAAVRRYIDAGFDHLVLTNAGPDPDGFLDFYARELGPAIRELGS
ncbi:TIGR03557 family F420-dependent LLM class oxidoreductase [Rhodococcus sp. NPDC058505]|uniref:TIGR03557 family F420-dependent LLM class oxidoreductase n=1 Tax=unclassified Rhodococcus (in: high G+C Gram-positive bacteria) TaxID=192944 RepID=UPI00366810DE